MKKALGVVLVLVLALSLALSLGGCKRKVTITTGEIIVCTAGEVIEDNTREVEVPEDEVMDHGVKMTVVTCDLHDLERLYAEAQQAIAEGDLGAAAALLETIVATDPAYGKAKQQLDAINAGQTPEPDGTPAPAPDSDPAAPEEPATPEEPVGPVANLTKYVPDAIEGYVAQGVTADVASLSRSYLPTAGPADQLIIEVDQRASDAIAEQERSAIIAGYPDNSTTRTINGKTVVAGVQGSYAAAVFTDGSLTIIVELHAGSGSGAGLIEAVFAVAEVVSR